MIEVSFYKKNILKSVELFKSDTSAQRNGQNWRLLGKDNTYKIRYIPDFL